MGKARTFKNDTKVTQVFYDRFNNPIELKPGQSFTEDLSGVISVGDLLRKEMDRRALADDVDEKRRVVRKMAQIRATKSVDLLESFKEGEKNQDVLDAIILKQKELLDDTNIRGVEADRAERPPEEGGRESVVDDAD